MKKRRRTLREAPHVVTLAHPSYQPSKAEIEEEFQFPEGTTPEDLARAVMRPVTVRHVRLIELAAKRAKRGRDDR